MLSLENRKPWGDTTAALQCTGRLSSSPNLLAEVHSREMRGSGHQLKQGGLTGYRKSIFPQDDSQALEKGPSKAVQPP